MPNKPRPDNRARPVRIEDAIWTQVKAAAKENETTPSEIVRQAIHEYLGRHTQ